jgi:DNA (cytosine-5)-methyltransferase 1
LHQVQEAAALQSFPDTYELCGTLAEQYRQVGNAVPVKLARAVARSIEQTLEYVYEDEDGNFV